MLRVDVDAVIGQLARDVHAVGVDQMPEQNLGPDRDDLRRCHQSITVSSSNHSGYVTRASRVKPSADAIAALTAAEQVTAAIPVPPVLPVPSGAPNVSDSLPPSYRHQAGG